MITRSVRIASAIALATGALSVQAALVNLSGWSAEGGSSNWTVAADNNSVFQTVNGDPTIFFSGSADQGLALSGKITVETTGDDDYIGFVLGYNSGDVGSAAADYILIDWKQLDQGSFGCTAKEGLAISRVTGPLVDNAGAWCHANAAVTELQRGANLGSTGWADNTEYNFDLVFTATQVQVKVDGVLELDIAGTFGDGSFGFYNYSQQNVRYSALTTAVVPPITPPVTPPGAVPEPGSLALGGLALLALAATRRR